MEAERTTETTRLLRAWAGGNPEALEELIPRVYRELRRIAGRCNSCWRRVRQPGAHTARKR